MRRFTQGDGWGSTPVLRQDQLFPKRLPFRLSLRPTGWKEILAGAGLDVIIGRNKIVSRLTSARLLNHWLFHKTPLKQLCHSIGLIKQNEKLSVKDYIGVAVHYTPMPHHWSFRDLFTPMAVRSLIPQNVRRYLNQRSLPAVFEKGMSFLPKDYAARLKSYCTVVLLDEVVPPEEIEGCVSLYLLHEDRRKDLLLYYADHEDEVIALWRFWSRRLALPQLLVAPDGTIDEPMPSLLEVDESKALPRKAFHHLRDRRPVFLRVRETGRRAHSAHCTGREIMART